VARAVPHLTETHFTDLETQLKRMESASSNRPLWVQLHAQFHEMIYTAAGMPYLLAEIARAQERIQPFHMMYIDLYHVPEMPGVEHASLIQVLRKRDPNLAATALADHIRSAASGVIYFILSGQHPGGETLSHIDPVPLNMEKR
jgi:DNA-binding GntR family transcriptional regulator